MAWLWAEEEEDRGVRGEAMRVKLQATVAAAMVQRRHACVLEGLATFAPQSPLALFVKALAALRRVALPQAERLLASFCAACTRAPGEGERERDGEHNVAAAATCEVAWVRAAAASAADASIIAAPTAYDRDALLRLLAPSGLAGNRYARWKLALELLGEQALWEEEEEERSGATVSKVLLAAGRWDDARAWAACCGDATAAHDATLAQAAALVAEWHAATEFPSPDASNKAQQEVVDMQGSELEQVGEELWTAVSQLFVDEAVPAERAGSFLDAAARAAAAAQRSRREQHAVTAEALRWLSGAVHGGGPAWPLPKLEELERRVWLLSVGEEQGGVGGDICPAFCASPSAEEQRMTAVGLLLERGDLGGARALVPPGQPVPLSVAMAEAAAAVAAGRTTVAAAVPAAVAAALSRTGARPAPPATDWRAADPVEVLEAIVAAAAEGGGRAFCERCLADHLAAQVRDRGQRCSLLLLLSQWGYNNCTRSYFRWVALCWLACPRLCAHCGCVDS